VDESMRAYVELERALRAGDVPRARAALVGRAGFPNLNDPYTNTPLLALALSWAPADAVAELLDLGADPNFEARDGFPALLGVILSERDDKHVLSELLLKAGADVERRGLNDWTPLHAAAAQDDAALVEELLRAGADRAARTAMDDCETPLELAARAGNRRAAAALEPGAAGPA
jgi:ankyrin repeat protein